MAPKRKAVNQDVANAQLFYDEMMETKARAAAAAAAAALEGQQQDGPEPSVARGKKSTTKTTKTSKTGRRSQSTTRARRVVTATTAAATAPTVQDMEVEDKKETSVFMEEDEEVAKARPARKKSKRSNSVAATRRVAATTATATLNSPNPTVSQSQSRQQQQQLERAQQMDRVRAKEWYAQVQLRRQMAVNAQQAVLQQRQHDELAVPSSSVVTRKAGLASAVASIGLGHTSDTTGMNGTQRQRPPVHDANLTPPPNMIQRQQVYSSPVVHTNMTSNALMGREGVAASHVHPTRFMHDEDAPSLNHAENDTQDQSSNSWYLLCTGWKSTAVRLCAVLAWGVILAVVAVNNKACVWMMSRSMDEISIAKHAAIDLGAVGMKRVQKSISKWGRSLSRLGATQPPCFADHPVVYHNFDNADHPFEIPLHCPDDYTKRRPCPEHGICNSGHLMGCAYNFLEMSGTSCVWTNSAKSQMKDLTDTLVKETIKRMCQSSSTATGTVDLFVRNDWVSQQPLFSYILLAERLRLDYDPTILTAYNYESGSTFLLSTSSDGSSFVGLDPSLVKLPMSCILSNFLADTRRELMELAKLHARSVVSGVWFNLMHHPARTAGMGIVLFLVTWLGCVCIALQQQYWRNEVDFLYLRDRMLQELSNLRSSSNRVPLLHVRDRILHNSHHWTASRQDYVRGKLFLRAIKYIEEKDTRVQVTIDLENGVEVPYGQWVALQPF